MKIGVLITARLKSSRLPFKLLNDLNGKMVIERVIDRAREIQNISEVVLCTSTNSQDRPLVDIAKKHGIYYFNGSEDDVLYRLLTAAQFYEMDYFINITADNPLFSVHYANLVADSLRREERDFIKITGLPLGTACYGLKTKAVELVCRFKELADTEIWGYLINRPEIFNVKEIEATAELYRPGLRLTLDYQEDYNLINKLYHNISFDHVLHLHNVMNYLENNSDLIKINAHCEQKQLDIKTRQMIDDMFASHRDEILSMKQLIY